MRKSGMIWKTPWKKRSPALASAPVPMWFFTNFKDDLGSSSYEFPNPSPCPGDGAGPFWAGMIAAFDLSNLNSLPLAFQDALVRGQGWNLRDEASKPTGGSLSLIASGAAGFGVSASVPELGATYRAIVSLITSEPDGLGNNITKLYVDGVYKTQVTLPYVPAGIPMFMGSGPSPQIGGNFLLHGWAGGNATLTSAEIQQWFLDSRYNLEIAQVPSKTSDRITATSVAPLAPPALPNLAGGQPMLYVAGTPDPVVFNTQLDVTFAY